MINDQTSKRIGYKMTDDCYFSSVYLIYLHISLVMPLPGLLTYVHYSGHETNVYYTILYLCLFL